MLSSSLSASTDSNSIASLLSSVGLGGRLLMLLLLLLLGGDD
jgi:hypothetical protein